MTNELTNERLREIEAADPVVVTYTLVRAMAAELLAKRQEVEALTKDQQDWRKGVDLIRTPLVKFAKKSLPTLSCVDISRAVLDVCAEVDRLSARLADVERQRDELVRVSKEAHSVVIQLGAADEADEIMADIEAVAHPELLAERAIAEQPPAEKAEGGA